MCMHNIQQSYSQMRCIRAIEYCVLTRRNCIVLLTLLAKIRKCITIKLSYKVYNSRTILRLGVRQSTELPKMYYF